MTLAECTGLLAPVALAFRADMDEPTFKAYYRVLRDVPVDVAETALTEVSKSGSTFMPSAPQILVAAERVRRAMLAAAPLTGCPECEGQTGFRQVAGQKAVERCPCVEVHRARLRDRGVLTAYVALPGEAGVGENEPVYPTLEQLPAALRQQLQAVASRKLLR